MHFHVVNDRPMPAIKPLLLVSLLAGCFSGSAAVWAQETDGMDTATLEPLVVTASRVEQLQKDAIPSTTVITSQMIENKKLVDLPSLLRSEAGIDFARTGGAGQSTSVFMRGTESRQMLVILDGVPIRDAVGAGTIELLSHLQPDQIDRIEVVRGNVSAIYGSGAMGGVIQIFTKQGTGKPTAHVFGEYGTDSTTKIGAGISGRSEAGTSFALSATRFRTDGFSATNPNAYGYHPDDDYNRNISISASLSQKLNQDHELGMNLYTYDAKLDMDGSGRDYNDSGKSKQWTGAIYSKNRMTQNWLSMVTVSHTDIKRQYRYDNLVTPEWSSKSDFHSETSMLQWDNQFTLSPDWIATAGIDLGNDKAEAYSEHYNRDRYSVYAGVLGNLGAHHLQANVRYDHVDDAGADTTGYLGYSYDLSSDWKLLASVSTSFLAPTLDQQYADADMGYGYKLVGNPNLKSERSTNYEMGIQYAKGKNLVRLTAFEWHTRDLIQYGTDPVTYYGTYYNVSRAKNTGAELTLQTEVFGLDIHSNLTWQNPKNRETDEQLGRRAKFFGALNVSKTIGSWYLGGDIQYTGHRPDGTEELGSYALVNLNARYTINKSVSVYAHIRNLFDKKYETAYGYNQPDRGAFVGVNVAM